MTNNPENFAIYGARLLPRVLDEHAEIEPGRVYASYAISTDLSQGFRDVTMKEMASAVNCIAWWLLDTVGRAKDFESVAYIGTSDLRYPIFCLAAIKCGWKVLLLGPRNSTAQNTNLLKRTKCTKMVYSLEMARVAEALSGPELELTEIRALEDMLIGSIRPFLFERQFPEVKNDPILILHSSGSTGNPKLITMTHGTFSVTDNDRNMPTPAGRRPQNAAQFDFSDGGRYFSCFPPYHLAGIQAFLVLPIFATTATLVLGPTSIPPSGALMVEVIRQQNHLLKAFYVPPSIIEQWAQEPEGLEQARQLDFVLYGGGPLSPAIGNQLSEVTDVCQMYGSAETGQIQLLVPERGQWAYMEWNPYEEVDMQPSLVEGTFEMVLHHDPKFINRRSLHQNFPEVKEWRTGDLFVPHPKKPGLWRFHARLDDLILLSNSHKVNPVALESELLGHSWVSGALVIGTGRPQPALLLELKSTFQGKRKQEWMKQIWPIIARANSVAPEYAQLAPSMVILGVSSKPFVRAPKGTVVRRLTIEAYATEIESMYATSTRTDFVLKDASLKGITDFIHNALTTLVPESKFSNESDIFDLGLDSIKVTELVAILRQGLRTQAPNVSPQISTRTVYQHPKVSLLATALSNSLVPVKNLQIGISVGTGINDLVEKYSHDFPKRNFKDNLHILLTGSTGSLGSYVLKKLLRSSQISRIYCLNRSGTPSDEQLEKLRRDDAVQKTEFFQADFSKPRLGLSEETYISLLASVDTIIHLAWRVDFNLALESYETHHIQGVRSLVDFSVTSERHPRIILGSSISYAVDWAAEHSVTIIPEEIISSASEFSTSGYAESKQVAEILLAKASAVYNIPVTVLRIGQISGPAMEEEGGKPWSKDEWIPSLIRTSKFLNLVPSWKASIDWIPVDILAQIVLDVVMESTPQSMQIYNIVNPCVKPWEKFAEILGKQSKTARIVPLKEWVEVLASHDAELIQNLENIPALKILPFFENLVRRVSAKPVSFHFQTEMAIRASKTLREMRSIDDDLLERWSKQFIR